MDDLHDDVAFRAKIRAFVLRKMAILNVQLGATVVGAAIAVFALGWSRQSLGVAALIVGGCNAGQGVHLLRGIPKHLQINRDSPALVRDLNRVSLGTEIGFVALWIILTGVAVVAALRAPSA